MFIDEGYYNDKTIDAEVKAGTRRHHMNDYSTSKKWEVDRYGLPFAEYENIGMTLGNVMNTFRMSLGDFDFA